LIINILRSLNPLLLFLSVLCHSWQIRRIPGKFIKILAKRGVFMALSFARSERKNAYHIDLQIHLSFAFFRFSFAPRVFSALKVTFLSLFFRFFFRKMAK